MNSRSWHKATLGVCCYLLFVVPFLSRAQNLVSNPSFEEIEHCPQWPNVFGYQLGARPTGWFSYSESPDYFTSCAPEGQLNGVPTNAFGFQEAYEGGAYSGMFAHLVDDFREMIGAELLEPLTIGQTYYGSFWANAAYGGPQQTGSACNNIGMLFTMEPNIWTSTWQGPPFALRNYAQVYSQQVIADTIGWTLVSGSFVADSAYRYVVIGNHFNNANTTVQVLGPGNPNKAYVLLDAMCLSTDPQGCPMWTTVAENTSEHITMWPNPASEWLRVRWGALSVQSVVVQDAIGRTLLEQGVRGAAEFTFAVHDRPAGTYHVVIQGEGMKLVKSFVVMH